MNDELNDFDASPKEKELELIQLKPELSSRDLWTQQKLALARTLEA
jgi:hypothetical protein